MTFLIAAASPGAAWAASNVEIFAGGQFDYSNYGYIGATVPLNSNPNSGFAIRGFVDAGGYNYLDDLGTVKANFGGGELDALYRISRDTFWSEFGLGIDDTYTGTTPDDPSNPLNGEQAELRLSTDGATLSGPWRVDWEGYYGPRLQDYNAMVGGTHSLSSSWRLGAQFYIEGNPTYSLYEAGPYAGFTFAKDSELEFSAGEAWESGVAPRTYVRALIYQRL